jgi:hypothetical protein
MEDYNIENQPATEKKNISAIPFIIIGIILVIAWVFIRPGIFSIQPIGALPDGITFIYYGRSAEMSFFSSPDRLCLEIQDGVSLLCRGIMLGQSSELVDRIILRLPYSEWAYLQSTNGQRFDR